MKDRVENWKKNVISLTNEIKKQTKILDEVNEGENTNNVYGNINISQKKDYFQMIFQRT